ncbi:MAG: DUF3795 domain-containing protein [Armatimonadota bacterium]|nr:DUF3795 domain-containing protein [Armatimonadota bacterium]MDR5697783.1 DUF3795 domain-containing protein [Armatimonadota bacterium]
MATEVGREIRDFAGVCGLYWEASAWYETLGVTCGMQALAPLVNVCPVYACAKQRGVEHCGVCPEFPCHLLVNLSAQSGPGDPRIESAALRAALGDEAWAEWARAQQWAQAFCPLRDLAGPHPSQRARGYATGVRRR